MCNVCVAGEALSKPEAGTEIEFELGERKERIFFRAKNGTPEGTAEYQIRKLGEKWPTTWQKTDDLSGSCTRWGLDFAWTSVPPEVRDWVKGLRKAPTENELLFHN